MYSIYTTNNYLIYKDYLDYKVHVDADKLGLALALAKTLVLVLVLVTSVKCLTHQIISCDLTYFFVEGLRLKRML